MKRTRHPKFIICTIATCMLVASVAGQNKPSPPERQRFDSVPTILSRTVSVVGPRLTTKGKERTVFTGQYTDEFGAQFTVQVDQQLPNLVILQGFGKNAQLLKFNGKGNHGRKAQAEEALLESFAADTAEGMLASIQEGAAVRLLGRSFKPSPKEEPNYRGAGFDIFEVTGRVAAIADEPVRMKFYSFDSATGLLAYTRYKDRYVGRGKDIEVRFSNWQVVGGSAYAGRIERYEDGRLVFSVAMSGLTSGPRVDSAAFND